MYTLDAIDILIFKLCSILYETQWTEAFQSETNNHVNNKQGNASSFTEQKNIHRTAITWGIFFFITSSSKAAVTLYQASIICSRKMGDS